MASNIVRDSRNAPEDRMVDHSRLGPARLFAIIFGVAYLAVAITEVALGIMGNELMLGGLTVLSFAPIHNIVHWVTGLTLLGVLAFGRWPTKMASRTVGFAFIAVFLLGLLTPDFVGMLMGHGSDWPMTSYNIVHATTGVFGLLAGFMSHAQPYMVRTAHRRMA